MGGTDRSLISCLPLPAKGRSDQCSTTVGRKVNSLQQPKAPMEIPGVFWRCSTQARWRHRLLLFTQVQGNHWLRRKFVCRNIIQALDTRNKAFKISQRAAADGSTISDMVKRLLQAAHAAAYSCMVTEGKKSNREQRNHQKSISRQWRKQRTRGEQVGSPSFVPYKEYQYY